MPSKHKTNPVTFRPPEGDRIWLYAHAAETGRSVGSILAEALAKLHAEHSGEARVATDPMTNFRRGRLAKAAVTCPHCGAAPGVPCHRPVAGDHCPPHQARRREAERQERKP